MKMLSIVKNRSSIIQITSKHVRTILTTTKNNLDDRLFDPPSHEPGIPPYEEKTSEDVKTKKARLLYQSRKRGMLENGLLLSTFAQKYLNTFNESQLKMYDKLINLPSNDWDIYNWATGSKQTPLEFDNEVMNLFKKHVQNAEREARLKQPDL